MGLEPREPVDLKSPLSLLGPPAMIDEELYKIATNELNSDDRKPDVWARACALASDDHDEARFLYTNLRVEEMLNKDGKQRTFSTTRQQKEDLGAADELESLSLASEEGSDAAPASRRTGITDNNAPLPIDDLLDYDANDTSAPTSVAGNALNTGSEDSDDNESWTELESLAKDNASSNGALSNLTGQALKNQDVNNDLNVDDILDPASIIDAETEPADTTASSFIAASLAPENQRTAKLSKDLERQVDDMDESVDESIKTAQFDAPEIDAVRTEPMQDPNTHAEYEARASEPTESVRTDYADSDIFDDEVNLNVDTGLDTGVGRSFMVFSRRGALKAIKRGVSWPALFFTFPWLLSKAMFGTALIYGCLWLVSLAGLYTTANHWLTVGSSAPLMLKLWTLGFAMLVLIGLFYIPFRYGNRWVADEEESA